MAEARRIRLGELLVDAGLLTPEELEGALQRQKTDGRRLGRMLVAEGVVDEGQLTQILSHQLSVPWVSLHHIEFSRQLLNLVPAQVADAHDLVPIYVRHVRGQGQTLYLAMEDPQNEDGLAACRNHSGLPVRPMIASPSEIRRAIHVYYAVGPRPASRRPAPEVLAPVDAEVEPPLEPIQPSPVPAPAVAGTAAQVAAAAPTPPPAPPSASPPVAARIEASRVAPATTAVAPRAKVPGALAALKAAVTSHDDEGSGARGAAIPEPAGRAPRMVALTLLDGTTLQLPARGGAARAAPRAPTEPPPSRAVGETDASELTARDLVSALRAVSHGADATEVLGDEIRWEAMFAALLSLLLKKHLIADWEFVEEYRKTNAS